MTPSKISSPERIALIGSGHWGKNLVRNMHGLGALCSVSDEKKEILEKIGEQYPDINLVEKYPDLLSDPEITGVMVATPAATHYEISKDVLSAGKDVFVEKPLALRLSEARELVDLAAQKKRILMVGHLLQYHPGMLKLKELIESGELGQLEYVYSNRLNLGKIRREENALWSFAPHDISVMLWLLESLPIQVTAVGGNYLQPNVADTTISTFSFDNGVRGHIYVSWLHPFKEQRLVIVGSKRMASFDDCAPKGHKLLLYDKKVSMVDGNFVAQKTKGVMVSFDDEKEPLQAECEHFLECVRERKSPRTNGEEGLRVLKVLQCCQRSLQMNGQPVQVMDYRD